MEVFRYINREGGLGKIDSLPAFLHAVWKSVTMVIQKHSLQLWHMKEVSEHKAKNKHTYTGLSCLCPLVRVLIENVEFCYRDGSIQQAKKVKYLTCVNIAIIAYVTESGTKFVSFLQKENEVLRKTNYIYCSSRI